MKKKVFVFGDMYWSVNRVCRDVEKQLADDFEFVYMHWGSYDGRDFVEKYNWCDVCLTNVACLTCPFPDFPNLNFKKTLFVSHGFPDNKFVTSYPTHYMYGMTSDSILSLFPSNLPVLYTPNGVDPDHFVYNERSGALNRIGWAGTPHQPYKQVSWAAEIADKTDLSLDVVSKLTFAEMKDWYHTIDILLVTTGPESWAETGPLPAFEAIVSGVLVLGTPAGNFRKVPGPKFSSIEEGVHFVSLLKKDPEQVKRIAREQYDYVLHHWTYKQLAHYWRSALYATMR
jgi:hypothetical protein